MAKYRGVARYYVDVEFEVELSKEEFSNGDWYEICLQESQDIIDDHINYFEFDGVELEADDLELLDE